MRIWDISPKKLCRNHLLGEHRELHAIWAVLTKNKTGYSKHPETLRWKGKLKSLYLRHKELLLIWKEGGITTIVPYQQGLLKAHQNRPHL